MSSIARVIRWSVERIHEIATGSPRFTPFGVDNAGKLLGHASDADRARITRPMEMASLERYCELHGYNPRDYARACHEQQTLRARSVLEDYRDRLAESGATEIRSHYERIAESADVWEATRLVMLAHIASVIDSIVEHREYLRLNWNYVARLADSIGIREPSNRHPERLRALLLSIPQMTLWGNDFGASIWSLPRLGIPVVIVNHLLAATDLYLNVLATILFDVEDERVYQRTIDEIAARAEMLDVAEAMGAVLEIAVGRVQSATIDDTKLFNTLYPHLNSMLSDLSSSAMDFVLYHEYAHVLFGHIELEPSHRLEYDADWFAATLSARTTGRAPSAHNADGATEGVSMQTLGMVAMLMLLIVIESAAGAPLARSHPMAAMRLFQLINMSESAERAKVVTVADAIQYALRPAMKTKGLETFGILFQK